LPSFPFAFKSFPAPESSPMNQLFTSGVQSVGALASTSVLPINIQSLFPLGLTGARDAITAYHQEAVLNNRNILSLGFGSQKSEMKMLTDLLPSGGCDCKLCSRHHFFFFFFCLLDGLLLLMSLPIVFSVCVSLCSISPFFKGHQSYLIRADSSKLILT